MRALTGVLPFAAALALLPGSPLAGQRSLVFEDFHSEIVVRGDGDILVRETLRPRFTGSWNGILRVLNLAPPAAYGARYLFDVRLLSATDGEGRGLRHEVERVDRTTRRFRIWVPNAENRSATVVLTYRVSNALGFFAADSASGTEPWDELYWQVTGTEWEVPILRASARVELPPGARPMQAAAYVGGSSSTERTPITLTDDGVEVGPVGELRPGEGLTLGVGWPAGAVTAAPDRVRLSSAGAAPGEGGSSGGGARAAPSSPPRSPGRRGLLQFLALLPILIPAGVLWLAYSAWDRRGRDPKERAIVVHWEPPTDLSPAEAGTLVDNSPGLGDIVSTLVDLAVRGYIVIEERDKKGFLSSGKDYAFHLMKPREEWSALAAHERTFLDGLFSGAEARKVAAALEEGSFLRRMVEGFAGESADDGAPEGAVDSVLLSTLQNAFYKTIPKIKDDVFDRLVAGGHYLRRPDRVRALWLLAGVVSLVPAFGGFMLGAGLASRSGSATPGVLAGALLFAGVASALILFVFAWVMPARTTKGARTREAALGFKRFLQKVETPRFRRMITSPDQFERYLPFAMAFGCEKSWAAAFEDLLTEPPRWYYGHGQVTSFQPSVFVSDLGKLTSAATSTLSSSPSSSGSGGGGSVGGGGGGGGGGGF